MGDEQGDTGVLSPDAVAAVEAEVARIIRAAEVEAGRSYRADVLRPYAYKILRETIPGFTRDRWREITAQDPDTRYDPQERAERQAQERARAMEAQEARELLRQHGRPVCCPECDVPNAARLRQELAGRDAVPIPEVPAEVPQERTCECDQCTDDQCQGDCERCNDHGCEQCYSEHNVYECCGYCEECDSHVDDHDRPEVCDRGHCHECDHRCFYGEVW